jgi:hypothetical protein
MQKLLVQEPGSTIASMDIKLTSILSVLKNTVDLEKYLLPYGTGQIHINHPSGVHGISTDYHASIWNHSNMNQPYFWNNIQSVVVALSRIRIY